MPITNKASAQFGQLNPDVTDEQFASMGYDVLWRRGFECPRRIENVDNHDNNCPLCDSTGFIYDVGQQTRAIITGISIRQMYQSFGRFDAGMAEITLRKGKLSWWDKVILLNSTMRYTQSVLRGSGESDALRYDIATPPEEADVLFLRDMNGNNYVKGTHYSVVSGKLVWTNGPAEGVFYSIGYHVRPTYIVLDVTHQIRNFPTDRVKPGTVRKEFPSQGVGKLEFLVRREGGES